MLHQGPQGSGHETRLACTAESPKKLLKLLTPKQNTEPLNFWSWNTRMNIFLKASQTIPTCRKGWEPWLKGPIMLKQHFKDSNENYNKKNHLLKIAWPSVLCWEACMANQVYLSSLYFVAIFKINEQILSSIAIILESIEQADFKIMGWTENKFER